MTSRSPGSEPRDPSADAVNDAVEPESSMLGSGTLLRFRIMAWTTGVLLLVLVFVAMPLKYVGDDARLVHVVGVAHGWLYMAYLVAAFLLAYRLRWPLPYMLLLLLAGTVPFASFYAERQVMRELR